MENINDGGPAFPSHGSMGEIVCEGMTLMDYFANSAMKDCINERGFLITPKEIAKRAYEVADAMLKARKANP